MLRTFGGIVNVYRVKRGVFVVGIFWLVDTLMGDSLNIYSLKTPFICGDSGT